MRLEVKLDNRRRVLEVFDGKQTVTIGSVNNEDGFNEIVNDIFKYAYKLGKKEGIKDYILDEEMYNRNRNQSLGLD